MKKALIILSAIVTQRAESPPINSAGQRPVAQNAHTPEAPTGRNQSYYQFSVMRKGVFIKILLLSIFCGFGCKNNTVKNADNDFGESKITYFGEDYHYKYYLFSHFNDNEDDVKYLFDFAKDKVGSFSITTDENGISFEDNYGTVNFVYQDFFFVNFDEKKSNNYEIMRVGHKELTVIKFSEEKEKGKIKLYHNFEELNVDIVQNLLDYAKENVDRKEQNIYTYELYNINKEKKIVLTYHEFGKWFEIDII